MVTVSFMSPLGIIYVAGNEEGTAIISCQPSPSITHDSIAYSKDTPGIPKPVHLAITQLQEYFNGQRQHFEFTLTPKGTDFQQRVWKELLTIPFGQTRSYLALSRQLGDEKAIRAVAAANGKNPLWIVVPCHRIIGSSGDLVGYAGGLWRKKWLLEHEQNNRQLSLF